MLLEVLHEEIWDTQHARKIKYRHCIFLGVFTAGSAPLTTEAMVAAWKASSIFKIDDALPEAGTLSMHLGVHPKQCVCSYPFNRYVFHFNCLRAFTEPLSLDSAYARAQYGQLSAHTPSHHIRSGLYLHTLAAFNYSSLVLIIVAYFGSLNSLLIQRQILLLARNKIFISFRLISAVLMVCTPCQYQVQIYIRPNALHCLIVFMWLYFVQAVMFGGMYWCVFIKHLWDVYHFVSSSIFKIYFQCRQKTTSEGLPRFGLFLNTLMNLAFSNMSEMAAGMFSLTKMLFSNDLVLFVFYYSVFSWCFQWLRISTLLISMLVTIPILDMLTCLQI